MLGHNVIVMRVREPPSVNGLTKLFPVEKSGGSLHDTLYDAFCQVNSYVNVGKCKGTSAAWWLLFAAAR